MPDSRFHPEDLAAFHRDGYFVERGLMPVDFCRRVRRVVDRDLQMRVEPIEYEAELHYPGAPESLDVEGGLTPRRLKQAVSRDVVFLEFLISPRITGRLRQLLGTELAVPLAHHNCIMTKQPGFSSDTGWHQDIRYWSFESSNLVSVWLALGPENERNGGLQVIPGTHAQEFEREQLDDALFLRDDLPQNAALIARRQPLELDCGDVLFFHCRTFHAASRNHTNESKYSAVFTFRGQNNRPIPGSRSASLPELLLPPPPAPDH